MNQAVDEIAQAPRLTEVMSRVRIDLTPLLRGTEATRFASALVICRHCRHAKSCDQWSSQREQGEAHEPPAFCPALAFLTNTFRS